MKIYAFLYISIKMGNRMAACQCWGSGSGTAPKCHVDPQHCCKLTVPVPAGSGTRVSLRTHLHSPCCEHCAGQPSSVQWRPFQPRTHRHVPFLHWPWSAQRGSHSRLWHCSPDQPAGNPTGLSYWMHFIDRLKANVEDQGKIKSVRVPVLRIRIRDLDP
jgi:hypothetical protein